MAIAQFLDDPFLTPKDIMERLPHLPRSTVYAKIRREMKSYKIGRRVFVKLSDFLKWLERQVRDPFDG